MIKYLKYLYWDIKKGGYFTALSYGLLDLLPGNSGNTIRGSHVSRLLKGCGGNLLINKGVIINRKSHLIVGQNLMINSYAIIEAGGGVEIGDNVLIGPSCKIWSINHRYESSGIPINRQGWRQRNVVIGDDVWLGTNTIVLPGATIPTGVIIGASSMVTASSRIEPYSVCAGNPIQTIKRRGATRSDG